jgi:polysaccharide biosynthesis transport protein
MPEGLVPSSSNPSALAFHQPDPGFGGGAGPAPAQHPLERPIAAVRRYKWLMVAIVAGATLLGVAGLQFITPQYEVRSIVWLASETPESRDRSGPIRSGSLLNAIAWVELLKSFRVVDEVVRQLNLYVAPEEPFNAPLFSTFGINDRRFLAGQFEIDLDGAKKAWSLKLKSGAEVEHGAWADSVGRKLGFRWVLPTAALPHHDVVRVKFSVSPPRDISNGLISRLSTKQDLGSNFLWLTFQDPDPAGAAKTLNAWAAEFVKVATGLKTRTAVEFSKVLDGQLQFAQASLVDAERALENFRVHTITLPAEGGPVAAGVEMTRDPALKSFFDQKIAFDNLRQDRDALEKMMVNAAAGRVPYEGLLQIESVAKGPGAEGLRAAFTQRNTLRAQLAVEQARYTDSMPAVKNLLGQLRVLENQTIPTLANQQLLQLREREGDFERRIGGASRELQAVPARTMEEMRLNRAVKIADGLYTTLKSRYAEAQLAEASASPDINILDLAVAPLSPTKNTAPMILLGSVLGGVAAAIALAILLDTMDRRFRYPHQATDELGLTIAGTIPRLPKKGLDLKSPEQVVQLIESFRSIRMHVMHSASSPTSLAVTSAAPGDGKSLVSANLAMSFAEAGLRTLLVDGDTRRGNLHAMFGAQVQPGLTEFLVKGTAVPSLIQKTPYDNLWILACGRRHTNSPELLSTPRLTTLVEALRRSYDVIIFDTPPLAAGIDGYAISAAAGNLLMVVRIGQTERRLAVSKLAVADRLPINMLGTVLNCVDLKGEFKYYGYAAGYSVELPAGELVGSNPD